MGNDYGYSLSDIAAATGRNNNGFGDSGAWWIILLLFALCGYGGFGGMGFGGFGGFGGMYEFPWLLNGQNNINANTNQGFDTLHLSNQLEGVRDGVNGIQNAICSSTASINSNISNGFYNAEIGANNRQMADMQQNYSNQLNTLQSFNTLNSSLNQCCCENRLATCQTQNIVQNEGNATRFADANNTRDIITNATSNTQAILDKLCQLELDGVKAQVEAKNDRISDLQRQLQMADLRASQIAQTDAIRDGIYNELKNCPVRNSACVRKSTDFYM